VKHPERIADYLEHIVEAIDPIAAYLHDVDDVAALERDHKTQAAVIRNVEIIGEAANRISRQCPDLLLRIPPCRGRKCAACGTG
jgi:uncharacterized protein with HEPN domain